MNDIKNRRIKEQRKLIKVILVITIVLCFLVKIFIHDEDLGMALSTVGAGLTGALIVSLLFKGRVGYKPTLEEIEELQFGKNNDVSNNESNAD